MIKQEPIQPEKLTSYERWQFKTYGNILPAATGHDNKNEMNEIEERKFETIIIIEHENLNT